MVVNAGCADKDLAHIRNHLNQFTAKGGDVQMEHLNRSLLALQGDPYRASFYLNSLQPGPLSEAILSKLVSQDISKMPFMIAQEMKVDGIPCLVSRCGYTGEDGFEVYTSDPSL